MRGNLELLIRGIRATRSIPAYAGEPGIRCNRCHACMVYPRVCGGTSLVVPGRTGTTGLSPRMRGNRGGRGRVQAGRGSIPAYAGEPWQQSGNQQLASVYPRVCGGTRVGRVLRNLGAGLSPRMRGNRVAALIGVAALRSIPAYAGEPQRGCSRWYSRRVYPRVCGGTSGGVVIHSSTCGLSPRMRGNRGNAGGRRQRRRSIPAYAGEPCINPPDCCGWGVYPRVCGGTCRTSWRIASYRGLSPRMRGNPNRRLHGCGYRRSIPAYAGEPAPGKALAVGDQVYPRVCGGTSSMDCGTG